MHVQSCEVRCLWYTATVVLNSSVGMGQACTGEMVTYTCTVNQGFVLDWIIEPFISIADPIRFALGSTPVGRSVDCNGITPPQCSNITFGATFTNTANRMTVTSGPVADMTSTLTITATVRLNGTVVQCRGATESGSLTFSRTLHIAGAPMLLLVSTAMLVCLATEKKKHNCKNLHYNSWAYSHQKLICASLISFNLKVDSVCHFELYSMLMPFGSLGLGRVSTLLLYVFEPSPQVFLLLPKLLPPLFSSMVGTVWPSQCSGSPHSMMVGLQSVTPSQSAQVLVHSPPIEQTSWSLCPTMWCTLSVLQPQTAMGAAVLPWITSELVCRYKVSSQTKADGKYPSVIPNCVIPVAFTAPLLLFSG